MLEKEASRVVELGYWKRAELLYLLLLYFYPHFPEIKTWLEKFCSLQPQP